MTTPWSPADASPRVIGDAPPGGWFDRPMRWAQLTLVENDPGRFDPPFWLDYFRRLHADAACSAPAASSPTTPPRSRCTTAARGSATAIRSATLVARLPRAGHGRPRAHRPARGVATTCGRRIPTGSPSTPDGEPRRHWAYPDLWVTCALGPYNFEFMDRGPPRDRHAVPRRRHLRQPLGAAGRRLLLRALPGELPARDRARAAAHDRRRAIRRAAQFIDWRKARLTELWQLWDADGPRREPRGARSSRTARPICKTAGELARHPVRRPPGAARR